jgi:2-oxoglutarate dehydrogenase complex dehydrogenase (E1) component-like enzyme
VVFTPKSLLRARGSRSPLDSLEGGSFAVVLDDPASSDGGIDTASVRRVLLCSGKIAYDAMARREDLRAGSAGLPPPGIDPATVAVVRLEQLYPWPGAQLSDALARYPAATEVVWLQDEPENMGPWSYAHGRLHRTLRDAFTLTHVSRSESASPATGSPAVHQLEFEDLMARAFA